MNLRRLFLSSELGDFIRHRYFMIGLGLQKGMPLLIIPVSIHIIGAGVYAQYVLVYTLVQVFAVLGSLSLAQAIFPFWYENESKESLVGSILLTMTLVEFALFAVIAAGLYLAWPLLHLDLPVGTGLFLILAYAFAYNLNALVLNILRLRLRQFAFLFSTAITSVALVGFILSLRFIHGSHLVWFTAVNIAALLLQTTLYMFNADAWPRQLFPVPQFKTFFRAVLRFSWPLTLYTLLVLLSMVADKWVVRWAFPQPVFARYVLDVQFAFSLSFLSVVIGMYNNQKLCELVYLRDAAGLRRNLLGNYGLAIGGSVLMAAAIYLYARFGGIHLTYGFWVLGAAFTLDNCYNVNSALLSAQKRSRRMVLIAVLSTLAFATVLSGLLVWRSLFVVYVAYLAYFATLLGFSWKSAWSAASGKRPLVGSDPEDILNAGNAEIAEMNVRYTNESLR